MEEFTWLLLIVAHKQLYRTKQFESAMVQLLRHTITLRHGLTRLEEPILRSGLSDKYHGHSAPLESLNHKG